ncbi:MAG: hypothetical protein Q9172_000259 [Xanthocarpia lactea]
MSSSGSEDYDQNEDNLKSSIKFLRSIAETYAHRPEDFRNVANKGTMACLDAAAFLEEIKNGKHAALGSNDGTSSDATNQEPTQDTNQELTQDTNNISPRAAATRFGTAYALLVGQSPGVPEKEDHEAQAQIQKDMSDQEVSVLNL